MTLLCSVMEGVLAGGTRVALARHKQPLGGSTEESATGNNAIGARRPWSRASTNGDDARFSRQGEARRGAHATATTDRTSWPTMTDTLEIVTSAEGEEGRVSSSPWGTRCQFCDSDKNLRGRRKENRTWILDRLKISKIAYYNYRSEAISILL